MQVNDNRDSPEEGQRVQGILADMKALEGRDLQLWSVGLLLMVILVAGIAAFLVPIGRSVEFESRFLFFGLYAVTSLVVLHNIYALMQRRTLRLARADLVRQLMRARAAKQAGTAS